MVCLIDGSLLSVIGDKVPECKLLVSSETGKSGDFQFFRHRGRREHRDGFRIEIRRTLAVWKDFVETGQLGNGWSGEFTVASKRRIALETNVS
jgi:hypothetical protein